MITRKFKSEPVKEPRLTAVINSDFETTGILVEVTSEEPDVSAESIIAAARSALKDNPTFCSHYLYDVEVKTPYVTSFYGIDRKDYYNHH